MNELLASRGHAGLMLAAAKMLSVKLHAGLNDPCANTFLFDRDEVVLLGGLVDAVVDALEREQGSRS